MSLDSGNSRVSVIQPTRGRKNATSRAGEAESKGYSPGLPVTENSLEPKSVINVAIAVRCGRFITADLNNKNAVLSAVYQRKYKC